MPETNITYLIIPEFKKFFRQQIKKKKKMLLLLQYENLFYFWKRKIMRQVIKVVYQKKGGERQKCYRTLEVNFSHKEETCVLVLRRVRRKSLSYFGDYTRKL